MTDHPRPTGGDGPTPLRLSLPSARRAGPPSPAASRRVTAGLVPLPGGTFDMGSEDPDVNPGDDEGPVRPVDVAPFRVAPTTVTNAEFARFVADTGYRTQAQEFGWSFVFHLFVGEEPEVRGSAAGTPWWLAVDGADWDHPEGPGSTLEGRADHPVVHVSREDALVYCAWSGTRLPTEAEWEYAARGGLHRRRYPWGDELTPGGEHRCNIWQGTFPRVNTAEDGYVGTAPVGSYPANGYGLHDVAGNVWEWTSTAWDPRARDVWVVRGGSYLCHDSYCNRYRVAARTRNTGDSSSGNTGFRVVADAG
ncbi:formylglycine-generating enzyme family protein [Isoptericola sp. NPDC057559]|uniref:formylglycine-generating enzyme family protein n=1 Tax=Isoptericola sp. NPDC057559 TaxID=3346168 RepID=UPI00368C922C